MILPMLPKVTVAITGTAEVIKKSIDFTEALENL